MEPRRKLIVVRLSRIYVCTSRAHVEKNFIHDDIFPAPILAGQYSRYLRDRTCFSLIIYYTESLCSIYELKE